MDRERNGIIIIITSIILNTRGVEAEKYTESDTTEQYTQSFIVVTFSSYYLT